MIRNFFYSVFFHFILCLIALFFFWQQKKEQNKKPEIVTSVVFMQTKNNQIKPVIKDKYLQPEPLKPKPELLKPKPEPVKPKAKPAKPKPKPETKIDKNLPKSETKKPLEKIPEKELVKTPEKEATKPPEEITPPTAMAAKKPENTLQDVAKLVENVGVVNLQVTKQDIEKQLNSTLSKRETFNIQAQFRACYKRALAVMVDNGKKPITPIVVKINLNSEGYIITNLDNIIDKTQYHQNENYKNSIDSIKKMIEFCNPIVNLAKEKYSVWQEIVLQLNENNNL